ncbi:hypothetical protein BD309DRAFT_984789 [Dichomitus squalens]|nr:hypothetical protein BD309DRAFT_984789 [Dichomitus squalens]
MDGVNDCLCTCVADSLRDINCFARFIGHDLLYGLGSVGHVVTLKQPMTLADLCSKLAKDILDFTQEEVTQPTDPALAKLLKNLEVVVSQGRYQQWTLSAPATPSINTESLPTPAACERRAPVVRGVSRWKKACRNCTCVLAELEPEELAQRRGKVVLLCDKVDGQASESLEAKLVAATSAPVTPSVTSTQVSQLSSLEGYIQLLERTSRATLALAIVVQRTTQHEEAKMVRIQSLEDELATTRKSLQHAEHYLRARQGAIESLENQLSSSTSSVDEAESHLAGLRAAIQRLEDELARERNWHAETGAALSDAEAQLSAISQTLTDAEAARDALLGNQGRSHTPATDTYDKIAQYKPPYGVLSGLCIWLLATLAFAPLTSLLVPAVMWLSLRCVGRRTRSRHFARSRRSCGCS